MAISESGERLRQLINKAIEDEVVTPQEYDEIINLAAEDGQIDPQEKAMLAELQNMIESKMVKFAKSGS